MLDVLRRYNEGKLLAFVPQEDVDAVLAAIRAHPCGKDEAMIGEMIADHAGKVFMETHIGGTRMLGMLAGEQLLRICKSLINKLFYFMVKNSKFTPFLAQIPPSSF